MACPNFPHLHGQHCETAPTDRHPLRGHSITTRGKKPATKAAHRNVARASNGDVVLNGGREG